MFLPLLLLLPDKITLLAMSLVLVMSKTSYKYLTNTNVLQLPKGKAKNSNGLFSLKKKKNLFEVALTFIKPTFHSSFESVTNKYTVITCVQS